MELRVLRYFLTVAREGSFSKAAVSLNLTQPTLSRQIGEMEEELQKPLFLRGKKGLRLTEAGEYLRARAEEILELAGRAKAALKEPSSAIGGDVHIAGGETRAMRILARAMKKTRDIHPDIRFNVFSGNAGACRERLEKGLADFAVFVRPVNLDDYACLNLPHQDAWGVLLRKDDPLARQPFVTPKEFAGLDLICSMQHMADHEIAGWLGNARPNIVGTYNLLYNAALMVEAGIGVALCLDGIADISDSGSLCFRPLKPALAVGLDVAWKRSQVFANAAGEFLRVLKMEAQLAPEKEAALCPKP